MKKNTPDYYIFQNSYKKYTLNNFLPFQNDLIKSQSDIGLKFEIRVRETMCKLNKTD